MNKFFWDELQVVTGIGWASWTGGYRQVEQMGDWAWNNVTDDWVPEYLSSMAGILKVDQIGVRIRRNSVHGTLAAQEYCQEIVMLKCHLPVKKVLNRIFQGWYQDVKTSK